MSSAPNHDGRERTVGDVIPEPPLGEIGEILSASTEVSGLDDRGWGDWSRPAVLGGIVGFIPAMLANAWAVGGEARWSIITLFVWLPVAAAATWWMRPRRKCTIVGRDGVASVELFGSKGTGRWRALRFVDVEKLVKRNDRVFDQKQRYHGTRFTFRFERKSGRPFVITGVVKERSLVEATEFDSELVKSLKFSHALHFALAAEQAYKAFSG